MKNIFNLNKFASLSKAHNRHTFKWNLPYLWDGKDEGEPSILVSYYGTHEKADPSVGIFQSHNLIEDINVQLIDDAGNVWPGNLFDELSDEVAKGIEEACEENFVSKSSGPPSKEDVFSYGDDRDFNL